MSEMKLRICDGDRKRVVRASLGLVEQLFAPGMPIREGTEITLAEGERWLTAVGLGTAAPGTVGEAEEFLVSGAVGENSEPSARVRRSEALRRFREFVAGSAGG